ncbi:hypothetical protein RBI13_18590 [Alcaligenaceae bacterium A4P071]|nr:hypothetical protein [Alcaligenaceae bacterium A4P071]
MKPIGKFKHDRSSEAVDDARLAAKAICNALRIGVTPEVVEQLWFALAHLPNCDDEEQEVAVSARAKKYGFRG